MICVRVFFRFIYCLIPFGWAVLYSGAAHLYVNITRNIIHLYVLFCGNLALRALIVLVVMYRPWFGNLALRAFIVDIIISLLIFFVRVYIFYHMFLVYCFVRSYRINSNSHVIIVTEASSQTRTVGAFRKLNNGDECGWRHSSSHTVQDRKATHSAAGIISAAPVMSAQPITRPAVTEALMTDATPPNSIGRSADVSARSRWWKPPIEVQCESNRTGLLIGLNYIVITR